MEYQDLLNFATESNRIEGITSADKAEEHAAALNRLLMEKTMSVGVLTAFVSQIQPNAILRTDPSCMVSIGGRIAPLAPKCMYMLDNLLEDLNEDLDIPVDPWTAHARYEHIHPFTDGNGRSGRALWLWQMVRDEDWDFRYPFLQFYYYQTLSKYSEGK